MCQIAVSIPDEVLYDMRMDKEEAADFARKAVALNLYRQKGVSIGYCAKIAGMYEEDFIRYLSQNSVSVFHFDDRSEFLEEMNNA